MYVTLSDLLVLFFLGSCLAFWWLGLQIRDKATVAVRKRCEHLDLQWLDQTIVLKRLRIRRGADGLPCLWRLYTFEFSSTGDERYQGYVSLLGKRIETIELPAHRLH
ncbi:MAG: DUF3301 domain-containing protein [Hahellaceae bacterium]|nr:DUF3301 domain-containing protein [Hahellaceae bacterium]